MWTRRSSRKPAQTWSRKKRGFLAPQHCIGCDRGRLHPALRGRHEARAGTITRSSTRSEQSAAQRHFFFAERAANKIPDVPKDTPVRQVAKRRSDWRRNHGRRHRHELRQCRDPLCDRREQPGGARPRARASSVGTTKPPPPRAGSPAKAGVAERMASDHRLARSRGRGAESDIVIEAVFENMEIKKQLFTRLDVICRQGAILATNTSTLDIDEIAAVTQRPGDVIGLHFFSPANVMRLLEVVRGAKTAPGVIATCMGLAKRIAKVPVLARVCHGFIGNRMLHAYFDQAFALLCMKGAQPEQVDKAHHRFRLCHGTVRDVGSCRISTSPGGSGKADGRDPANRRPALRNGPFRTKDLGRILPVRSRKRARRSPILLSPRLSRKRASRRHNSSAGTSMPDEIVRTLHGRPGQRGRPAARAKASRSGHRTST